MKNKHILKDIIKYQDMLNRKIDPNWISNRKIEDFSKAIFSELAELHDSMPWPWWKKVELDMFNIKVELVDILHFVVSADILGSLEDEMTVLEKDFDRLYKISREDHWRYMSEFDIILEMSNCLRTMNEANTIAPEIYTYLFVLVNRYFDNIEDFFKHYFVKNILNEIRQEKGYKEGSYEKYKNGVEDNVTFYSKAEDILFTSPEDFKKALISEN